jgi:hypothetical protein
MRERQETVISINNPGNLRPLPDGEAWLGQTGVRETPTGAYCIFADAEHGIRAMAENLLAYERAGPLTLAAIFATWAPARDGNDPASYAKFVAARLGVAPDKPVALTDPIVLVQCCKAIAIMENGHPPVPVEDWYPDATIAAGVALALGEAA